MSYTNLILLQNMFFKLCLPSVDKKHSAKKFFFCLVSKKHSAKKLFVDCKK
jgi:hypothetical protein